ncbi:hypothetical protein EXIGLDRAFT_495385 [Exidia glandulosa HHB12029]|uniref:F-box domain-containing protein n=1 Tax=Exidia glandulosa HHB12029 TaxID=1314781 RepID=A0A166N9R7_EXIGL|nr:hypothetical protein EXIGLDRAFT_495385 [Exidia glandulosa HHB12029]
MATPPYNIAQDLSGDVVGLILEHFANPSGIIESDHLLALSHVCVRWRQLIRDHRAFWRLLHLSVSTLTTGQVCQFLDRAAVAASRDDGATVDIDIDIADIQSDVLDRVLPAVATVIHRARVLSLNVDPTYIDAVYGTLLANPAPEMHELFVRFRKKTAPHVYRLSVNFLGGTAPQLHKCVLGWVEFPAQRIDALRNVRALNLFQTIDARSFLDIFPATFASTFPKLQHLRLCARTIRIQLQPGEEAPVLALHSVTLDTSCNISKLLSAWPSLNQAPKTMLWMPDRQEVWPWLKDIAVGEPFHLHLTRDPYATAFRICFVGVRSGKTRTSRECFYWYEDMGSSYRLDEVFLDAPCAWQDRITELTISQTVWSHSIVSVWLAKLNLRAVKQTVLVLDDPDATLDSLRASPALRVPSVHSLIVEAGPDIESPSISAKLLRHISGHGFITPIPMCSVTVRRPVTVVGH